MSDEGRIKQKLVESKMRWAEEGRLLTGTQGVKGRDRLPPGQHLVQTWPVLDLGIQPRIAPEQWRLAVDGLVANPVTWDFAAFQAQPVFQDRSDMHCVTAWSRYDNDWEGVSTRHLLEVVRPLPEARHVICHSSDGYTTNLTLEHFAAPDALLAWKWQGEPISREHGGPVRMIVPQFYLWKSAKWIKRLEFTANDKPGYWENRGYHNEGDPWKEERYE